LRPLFDFSEREELEAELGIDYNTQSWLDIHWLMKAKYHFLEKARNVPNEPLRYICNRAKELIDKGGWYRLIIQRDSENIS
jgi:hypothetical protein